MGRRAGAVTVGLDIWHLDIPEFLEMQAENGDQRRKCYDVFPQLIIPDEFMRRVLKGEDWTLFCPHEVETLLDVVLPEKWGDEFEWLYRRLEILDKEGELKLTKTVNAKELFKDIMRIQLESGLPYLWFKDTVNRANPNKHRGYIPQGNLCVAGETKILTDAGHIPIADMVDQDVNIWNGSEWSNVRIKQTGVDQPLLKVHLSNGESIECTYYHKFHLQTDYKGGTKIVDAKDLKEGDKLIKYELPLIEPENAVDFPYAYTSGFFCGDGSYGVQYWPEIDLYGEKKKLVDKLFIRNKLVGGGSHEKGTYWQKDTGVLATYDDVNQDRIVCKLPLDIPPKFTVPLTGYTIKSRLEWFAGLLDSDGTIAKNGTNESLQITSIHKDFLLNVRLMLQTLSIDSKVTTSMDGGYRPLPDGRGGKKEYFTQKSYRLLVSSSGLFQLSQLGLQTFRLQWQSRKPQRDAGQFIKVKDVELTCRRDNTYCFTEPKRHLGMFNGTLLGQCQESYSNVEPGVHSHCCNLDSLNLANLDITELATYAPIAVRILDNTIEITTPPLPEAKAHNDTYRTIGVGAMGLADYLAKRETNYSDLDTINELFEEMAYHCVLASHELAKERGSFAAFQGSDWQNGNAHNILPGLCIQGAKWQGLIEAIEVHGIRNSHIMAIAPNTSSSLVQGCTASILPAYSRFFYDKWAKGTVPIAPPYIQNNWWHYQENKTIDQKTVIKATATIQQWIDTGISMELMFNLNAGIYYPDDPSRSINAKDIYETLVLAWQEGCKAVYYIRSVQKDDFKEGTEGCTSCAN